MHFYGVGLKVNFKGSERFVISKERK